MRGQGAGPEAAAVEADAAQYEATDGSRLPVRALISESENKNYK